MAFDVDDVAIIAESHEKIEKLYLKLRLKTLCLVLLAFHMRASNNLCLKRAGDGEVEGRK